MGSFPSHSSGHQQNYIQPVNSRTPGFLYSQGSKGSMGSTKNIPLIEVPTPENQETKTNTNNQLRHHQDEEKQVSSHQKACLDTSRSKMSRSAKDFSTVVAESSQAIENIDDGDSSLLPEHSFQLFPGFTLGTNSRYSPHISSLPAIPLPHIGSLPISFKPTEIEFSKKNKRSFSLDERSDEQTKQERHLHSSANRRKMSVIPISDNNNLLPPDLSITISTPEESGHTKTNNKITLEAPLQNSVSSETEKTDPLTTNLSEFKMGTRPSPKKAPVADVPDFTNFQLGQKAPKQKKVGFMGPLVDIIVHGGLGLPNNNNRIRRHSYTPQPSADLIEKSKVSPPLRQPPNHNIPRPTIGLSPSPSEKRDLSKSVAEFVLPPPVDIEPSPKLFVATISKTRRMSLKDETAERLNDLLSKQRNDQLKL